MIPKRAIFYWAQAGPKMTRLRRAGIESFTALNPDWEVVILPGPEVATARVRRILDSDKARYVALAESGGVYFDTDIIFIKPFPEHWLNADVLIPLDEAGQFTHVACLGGSTGNSFFKYVATMCDRREREDVILNCQSLGIQLFLDRMTASARNMCDRMGLRMKVLPFSAVLPVPADRIERLWSPVALPIQPECIGIHWYGGDPLSMEMDELIDREGFEAVRCPVTDAVAAVLQTV